MSTTVPSAFVASRACAFTESPCNQRCQSGVGTSPSCTVVASYACEMLRIGYYDDFDALFGAGGSAPALTVTTRQMRTFSEGCWQKEKWEVLSTPNPASPDSGGTGYFSRENETARGDTANSTTDVGTFPYTGWASSGIVSGSSPDSKSVTSSSSSVVIVWSFSGTWVDLGGNTQPWTEVVTLTYSKPFTFADFVDETEALFLSLTPPTSDTHVALWRSADGTPYQDGAGYTGSHALYAADVPLSAAGAKWGGVEPYGPSPLHQGALSIVGAKYRLQIGQCAEFTRTGDLADTRLSDESKLLPVYGDVKMWVIPTSSDLSGLGSGDTWQKCIALATAYVVPTPDFPAPD